MAKNKGLISEFYCTKCGRKGIPIMRPGNKYREPGHLKKLYCIYCGEETNHCEIRPIGKYTYEDFQEEFELGRFVDGERIPTGELMRCSNFECPYNKNGRCWNSNHSFDCSHRPKEENKGETNEENN